MKIFALIFSVLVLVSSAVALRSVRCGMEYKKDGFNGMRCRGMIPSWSYNTDTNECNIFYYGGCFGSENRFDSPNECEDMCKQ